MQQIGMGLLAGALFALKAKDMSPWALEEFFKGGQ